MDETARTPPSTHAAFAYAGASVLALAALAHLIPRRGLWPWAVWAGTAWLTLGGLARATGGLLAPLTAHFVINGVGLLRLAGPPPPEAP